MKFQVLGEIKNVAIIASGSSVQIKRFLDKTYGKGRWRKMKGIATIKFENNSLAEVELHWFEAHGIGRKDLKIKRIIK